MQKPKSQTVLRKIAFVTDSIHPYNKGGKETRLFEISRRLSADGFDVHIYTMKWWDGPKRIEADGVHLHAICKLHPLYKNDRRSISEALLFGLATFRLLFEDFDVLDVDHMPFYPLFSARIVTWLRRKKLTATWHEVWGKSYWYEYLKGPMGLFGHLTEWLSFRLPDLIISNSEHTTRKLKDAGVTKHIITVPLGVDLAAIRGAAPSKQNSDVIFVGRLLAHKNAALLVEAIAIVRKSLPNTTCIIVGDGPEMKSLKKLVKKLNLNDSVLLTGFIENNSDIYGLMKSSKMLVLPSVREGFGLVVVEANAAGIPVITIDHSDNAAKDLIQSGSNGYLSQATAEDIAKQILLVLTNITTFKPSENIQNYGWSAVTRNIEKVLVL